ncbi:uncharacterized protein BDFB_011314, partial [Asbolus verrucosus]
ANWEIRNNSSNVAEVLNPKCYDSEDRDTFCTRHNLCYCREKRIRPRLFSRPRECIFDEDVGPRTLRQFKDEDFNVNYSKDGITSRNLGEFSSAHQTDLRQREDEAGLQKRGYDTQKRDKNASSEANLKRLSEFRKDHYFDTHSTEDLMKTIPEHRCVHRFGLDNRFLPQPLNADVYGESRCIICDKPMENPPVNKTDERFKKHKVGTFPKFYKYGLAPKKIYVCNDDNVKIEMMLKRAQKENWECPVEKQPNYFNTYALRYQKGVKVV